MGRVAFNLKIGVICHDAGGAEILSSYCKQVQQNYSYYLEGPALKIFKNKNLNFENKKLEDVISESDEFYLGTSGASNLEREVIRKAKDLGKITKSFIDHWVNYRRRFVDIKNEICLPTTIVAGDIYSFKMLKREFPAQNIEFIPNPYWRDLINLKNDTKNISRNGILDDTCLYVSDGLSQYRENNQDGNQMDEFNDIDLLRLLSKNLHIIDEKLSKICIRPHPSENYLQYEKLVKLENSIYSLGGKYDLFDEIGMYKVVVGYESMALVVALQLGARVISLRPKNSNPSNLPFTKIERLTFKD